VVVKKAEFISVIKEGHNALTTVSKEYFQEVINQAGLRRAGRVPTAVDPDMGSFFQRFIKTSRRQANAACDR